MELGIFKALERMLGLYSIVAVAWVGALVADLVINKPLGLSPPIIEFKRAHLYDINPVGVGAMVLAAAAGIAAFTGVFGTDAAGARRLHRARRRLRRRARDRLRDARALLHRARAARDWGGQTTIRCVICEHQFEAEDMAQCPAYSGPICSLCCSLETRCHDLLQAARARLQPVHRATCARLLPERVVAPLNTDVGHYLGVLLLFSRRDRRGAVAGLFPGLVRVRHRQGRAASRRCGRCSSSSRIIAGIGAWLFVLAQESRHVAEEETSRQTDLLMQRDRGAQAHRRQAAARQGDRGSRQPGQEPLRRGPEPRAAHAAQRHPRLFADSRTRPDHSGRAATTPSRSCGAAPSICPA